VVRPAPGRAFLRGADGALSTFDVRNARSTTPPGINDKDAVVGYYSGTYGFLRTPKGKIKPINVPEAQRTFATVVNDNFVIVGEYVDLAGVGHGSVGEADGSLSSFDIPGADTPFDIYPRGINSSAEITGWYTASDYTFHGCLRNAEGSVTRLDIGQTPTYPCGIDNEGNVVASFDFAHGFVRTTNGQISTLDYPEADHTLPAGRDKKGRVTGEYYSDDDGIRHTFLMKRSLSLHTGVAPPDGAPASGSTMVGD